MATKDVCPTRKVTHVPVRRVWIFGQEIEVPNVTEFEAVVTHNFFAYHELKVLYELKIQIRMDYGPFRNGGSPPVVLYHEYCTDPAWCDRYVGTTKMPGGGRTAHMKSFDSLCINTDDTPIVRAAEDMFRKGDVNVKGFARYLPKTSVFI